MSGFLKALAKVGLVELDPHETGAPAPKPGGGGGSGDADLDRLLAETQSLLGEANAPAASTRKSPPPAAAGRKPPAPPEPRAAPRAAPQADPPPPPRAAPPPPSTGGGIVEGRPFEVLYGAAQVPASPYPAEKLLRLLDGLAAMDPATRKAAIIAMDAADDAWAIEDPVGDARRKIAVLHEQRQVISAAMLDAEATAKRELEAQDQYQSEATSKIRAQIAELEALLQEEVQKVASERASIQARAVSAREAGAREIGRLEGEVSRLQTVLTTFGGVV